LTKPSFPCPICGASAVGRLVQLRSGEQDIVFLCEHCDFEFFSHDPSSTLAVGYLDESRLAAAGLDRPDVREDFARGKAQSWALCEEFLPHSPSGTSVLEVGCSLGYLLDACRNVGVNVTGVEIDAERRQFVRDELGITCHESVNDIDPSMRFDRIFLLYVLEYFPEPVTSLQRLGALLAHDGEIIVITPNRHEPLTEIWGNSGFAAFRYDHHSVGYHSLNSVVLAASSAGMRVASAVTHQGYSLFSHTRWFLTGKPMTTGVVGGDVIVERASGAVTEASRESGHQSVGEAIVTILREADDAYRAALVAEGLGNQIRVRLIHA
jgi:SAM-dependent methyltransferase